METEIENWIQKYDTEMSEKQVFVTAQVSLFPTILWEWGMGGEAPGWSAVLAVWGLSSLGQRGERWKGRIQKL